MARKSLQKRLQESERLLSLYLSAGMSDDYRFRFIQDMCSRMNRGKQMSSKQRGWLDSLIEEGVPAPKGDQEIIETIERALKIPGTEHMRNTLTDFLGRERKGWSLSEKQVKFRNRLLDEARDIEKNGPYEPSGEDVKKLQQCLKLAKSRSSMYWSTHPGEWRAMSAVKEWLEGERPHIDKYSVCKTISTFRVKFRELDNPYALPGTMIWTRVKSGDGKLADFVGTVVVPALIAGPPEIDDRGSIVYPTLADCLLLNLTKERLMKRKPRS